MMIMTLLFAVNILWAVLNWKSEIDLVIAAYQNPFNNIALAFIAPLFFLADIGITGAATSIFGFGGFYGSAMAIFMSNILSLVFFTPKGDSKDMVKYYRETKKQQLIN